MSERELLALHHVPVYQNKMYTSRQAAQGCATGDVVLSQHGRSGLVSNRAFDPDKLVYDGSYQNEQGHSISFSEHLDGVADTLQRWFAGRRILEIGCGKGAFLKRLRDQGFDATGIDPAYEGDAPYILQQHFRAGMGISGDAIILRHVLEHIPDPFGFLTGIREANGGQGLVYIEVPCFDWILSHKAWFDVFYEHVNYFRLADFSRMFLRVLESGHLFGGQYLYVVADLASLRDPTEGHLQAPAPVVLPEGFLAGLDRCARLAREDSIRIVWGAAAKGVMFTHHMRLLGLRLDHVVDINPGKQGRFLAGSGLPVHDPRELLPSLGESVDIYVMNSNYLAEIRAQAGNGPRYITVDQP